MIRGQKYFNKSIKNHHMVNNDPKMLLVGRRINAQLVLNLQVLRERGEGGLFSNKG
jgi:hypothetical protein